MKADLYISNLSFAWNGSDTDAIIIRKISGFCDLMARIHEFPKQNSVFVNYSNEYASTVINQSGIGLLAIVYERDKGRDFLGRDLYNRFLNAFSYSSKVTSLSEQDLFDLLQMEDEDNHYNGILVLNKTTSYPDSVQIVSTIKEWVKFRRVLLVEHPESGKNYLEESVMCFPNLVIHEDNSSSLDSFIKTHLRRITECLSVLNDHFTDDLVSFQGTHPLFVSHFGPTYGLDGSSFEGTGDEKFNKQFPDLSIHYCEPHLKMYHDDIGNNNSHCRIYFEFPPDNSTTIYVGFICEHL